MCLFALWTIVVRHGISVLVIAGCLSSALKPTDISCDWEEGEIRLVTANFKFVSICSENEVKLICDTNWTKEDAEVVCRALGLPTSGAVNTTFDQQGNDYGRFDLAPDCEGSEANLSECKWSNETWGCDIIVGVRCLGASSSSDPIYTTTLSVPTSTSISSSVPTTSSASVPPPVLTTNTPNLSPLYTPVLSPLCTPVLSPLNIGLIAAVCVLFLTTLLATAIAVIAVCCRKTYLLEHEAPTVENEAYEAVKAAHNNVIELHGTQAGGARLEGNSQGTKTDTAVYDEIPIIPEYCEIIP